MDEIENPSYKNSDNEEVLFFNEDQIQMDEEKP